MSYEITTEPLDFQCRHIFTDGRRCASPTLRSPNGHEPFCYYHHTTRRPIEPQDRVPRLGRKAAKAGFTLPCPSDLSERSGIQLAIGEVLRRIAANEIDSRRAGLLLYGLQIASLNLKKDSKNEIADEQAFVTEITHDPHHGILAPPAELHADEPLGSAQRLLEELGDVDDEPISNGNLTIDLQACAVSSRETIFRMSNFIPKPATPKLSGLGPKAQKLAALREKAAAQANNATGSATTAATSAAKPKNSVARKTAFQRKAT